MFMLMAVEDDEIVHLIISKAADPKSDQNRRINTPQKVMLKNVWFEKICEQSNLIYIC